MSTSPPPTPPREVSLPARGSPPPPVGLKCPRCDSTNTKFCYYNNYSTSQPRHFCHSCRRHWTRGGSLRNVPIGSPSRKIKKPSSPPSSSCSAAAAAALLGHFTTTTPPPSGGALDLLNNFNNPSFGGTGTTSIESLKMELHWNLLQQQRMALLYGGVGGGDLGRDEDKSYQIGESSGGGVGPADVITPPPPDSALAHLPNPNLVFFQEDMEGKDATKPAQASEDDDGDGIGRGSVATEWLFRDGSCGGSNGECGGNCGNSNESG